MSNAEYDLIVVGGGVGGCAAATEAAELGGRVLIIEVTDQVGGNAVRSTGYLAFAGTPMQEEQGITDTPEDFLADIDAEIERQKQQFPIQYNRELAKRFVEESADAYRYLYDLGVRWSRFVRRPTLHRNDRMAATVDTSVYRTAFEKRIADTGVEVVTNTRAIELIRENGRVVGVKALRDPEGAREQVEYRSKRGVILATGSYSANGALRERYQLEKYARTPYLGLDTVRGDGHIMAAALGADLVTMPMIPLFVVVPGAVLEDCIAVNIHGQRFHDENGPYDDRVIAVEAQPEGKGWYIFDNATAREKGKYIREFPDEVFKAETLEEIAAWIGCPADELKRTVDEWNAACRAGVDEKFGRVVFSAGNRELIEPPFYASRLVIGVTFPSGGVKVTENLEAVDVMGRTIPGLYAVGDAAGGLSSAIGLGGLRIAPAITLGRIAGREAMARDENTPSRQVDEYLMNGPRVTREDKGTVMMLHY